MKKLIVELSNERLITPSGLALVGGALGKSDLVKLANRTKIDSKRSQPQIKNGDILLSYIGLLCQGKTCYEAVQEFHEDPAYFKYALGIAYAIPSPETLRQRMDLIGSSMRDDILQANVTMFQNLDITPTPLENVRRIGWTRCRTAARTSAIPGTERPSTSGAAGRMFPILIAMVMKRPSRCVSYTK